MNEQNDYLIWKVLYVYDGSNLEGDTTQEGNGEKRVVGADIPDDIASYLASRRIKGNPILGKLRIYVVGEDTVISREISYFWNSADNPQIIMSGPRIMNRHFLETVVNLNGEEVEILTGLPKDDLVSALKSVS